MRLAGSKRGGHPEKLLGGRTPPCTPYLSLGADYVPPKPQPGLFEDIEMDGADEDDEENSPQELG